MVEVAMGLEGVRVLCHVLHLVVCRKLLAGP